MGIATIYAPVSLLALLCAGALLTRMLRPRSQVEAGLLLSVLLATEIVLLGYALSYLHRLAQPAWWAGGGMLILLLACLSMVVSRSLRKTCLRKPVIPREIEQRIAAADFRRFDTLLLLLLTITVSIAGVVNYALILSLEPATIDVLDYHLARIGYYLQQGHLGHFDANYWALVVHPKVAAVLMLYTYLVAGMANLTAFVQFLAYGVSLTAVYGMARLLGGSRRGAAFAALIFGLLIICLMEAGSAQNDLVLAAFLGSAGYFLLAYRAQRTVRDLLLAGLAFALAAGVKATFVTAVPSLVLVVLFAVWPRRDEPLYPRWRHLGIGLLGLLLALVVITMPSGYGENYRRYGNPIGPASVRSHHAFSANVPPGRLLRYGGLNILRYTMRTLSLDGVPETKDTRPAQRALQALPRRLFTSLGIDLESPAGCRGNFIFSYRTPFTGSENLSGWGVLGFLLVWPVVLLSLLGFARNPGARVFALAAVVFFFVQAFVGPYDNFHGRYFIMGALFAVPPLAFLGVQTRAWPIRVYLSIVAVLGCVIALTAVFIHSGTYVFPLKLDGEWNRSTFTLDRTAQVIRQDPKLYMPITMYESYVPPRAVVAMDGVRLISYLFFGENFSRTLINISPFDGKRRPIPPHAEFLIYSHESPYARSVAKDDVQLINDHLVLETIYLRKLKGEWRTEGE
ncbi:MAG: glycosyltransferase family 39 protein [Armatimonadota bacterium]